MPGDTRKIKVKCKSCEKIFLVNDMMSLIPKHAPRGKKVAPSGIYTPCIGSEILGIPTEQTIKS